MYSKVGFVPPILNVTPIHGYFFTGEETGSAHRTGGLTCGNFQETSQPHISRTQRLPISSEDLDKLPRKTKKQQTGRRCPVSELLCKIFFNIFQTLSSRPHVISSKKHLRRALTSTLMDRQSSLSLTKKFIFSFCFVDS